MNKLSSLSFFICVAKMFLTPVVIFLQQMNDDWVKLDDLQAKGFPSLLWETHQRLGYTETPMYYGCEYIEDGAPKCEIRVQILEHPSCPTFQTRYLTVYGRGLHDTCQKGARQALVEYCQIFEEDIESTPARFFPMPNQTTPTWCEKVQALQKIDPKTPEYTIVTTIKYLHALDTLYENQQQELSRWIAKAMEIGNEL